MAKQRRAGAPTKEKKQPKPRRAGQIIPGKAEDTWVVRVFLGRDGKGRRRYQNQTVRGKKKAAEAVLRDLLTRQSTAGLAGESHVTVNELLDEWLAVKRKQRRARTVLDYEEVLARTARPAFGEMRLAKLTPRDVKDLLTEMLSRPGRGGESLAPRTVRKAHEVLRNALQYAVVQKHIPSNPAKDEAVTAVLPTVPKVTDRPTITMAKLQAFLTAVGQDEEFRAYWLLLLFGGLRPSEALALRWSDLEGNAVTIRRVLVDKPGLPLHFMPPKTKLSARVVVLPTVVLDALHARQAVEQLVGTWTEDGLIFGDEDGQPLKQDRTRKSFKNLLKAAGLPAMRIYDLRHSCASLLLESGESVKIVSERLGHSTAAFTQDTYIHTSRGMQEQAAATLDKLVGR